MVIARVIDTIKQGDKIKSYIVEYTDGKRIEIYAQSLKDRIYYGDMLLTNYKLTSDNRLVKSKETHDFYLMHKDTKVGKFNIKHTYIEYVDNSSFVKLGKLPYNFKDIYNWVRRRTRYSCASQPNKLLEHLGVKDLYSILASSKCISLRDSFWVKPCNSDLTWKDISPFNRAISFDVTVSAFSMSGLLGRRNYGSLYSPDISTPGSYPHTWKLVDNKIVFLKAGSKFTLGGVNSGMEPFSEYFASQVCDYLKFRHVKYNLAYYKRLDDHTDVISTCECFTSDKYGSVSAHDLGLRTCEDVLNFCKKLSKNAYKTCLDMLFLDCLLYNTDRHFENIEFIMNNDTGKIMDIAPIFDNNNSLLPRFMEETDSLSDLSYRARVGTFDELYSLILKHKSYKSELLKLKKFILKEDTRFNLRDGRVEFLNKFIQHQVDRWLAFEKQGA